MLNMSQRGSNKTLIDTGSLLEDILLRSEISSVRRSPMRRRQERIE